MGHRTIVVVRSGQTSPSRRHLPNGRGISGRSAGARHLSLHLVVIPPGGVAEPHVHRGFETAIYVIAGEVETFSSFRPTSRTSP